MRDEGVSERDVKVVRRRHGESVCGVREPVGVVVLPILPSLRFSLTSSFRCNKEKHSDKFFMTTSRLVH